MTQCCCIDFIIENDDDKYSFDFDFENEIDFEFTECMNVIQGETYEGEYEVIPSAEHGITLETNNKVMNDDVYVHQIQYDETSNIYGTTVVIAS